MIATGIITAARPRATLAISIDSYRAAGFTGPVLVCDDGTGDIFLDGVSRVINIPPLGNLRNWAKCLQILYASTKAQWLMVCEDDITWASRAASALHAELDHIANLASAGGYSLYLPARMSSRAEQLSAGDLKRGWHWEGLQIGKSMWGAQCLLFTRAQAGEVLRALAPILHDPRHTKNVDAWVSDAINRAGRRIYWRVPCLVDHVLGDGNSVLYPDKQDRPNLRTKYFTGEP